MTHTHGERRAVIFGASGSGKSTLLGALADCCPPDRAPWLVDPLGLMHVPSPCTPRAPRYAARRYRLPSNGMLEADGPAYEALDAICHAALEQREVWLYVDETDTAMRRGAQPPPWMVRMVMHGRHSRCGWVWCTRRPAELARAVTSQADEIFVFRLLEPPDVQHVARLGFSAEEVISLPVGAFMHARAGEPAHRHESLLTPCTGHGTRTTRVNNKEMEQ